MATGEGARLASSVRSATSPVLMPTPLQKAPVVGLAPDCSHVVMTWAEAPAAVLPMQVSSSGFMRQ